MFKRITFPSLLAILITLPVLVTAQDFSYSSDFSTILKRSKDKDDSLFFPFLLQRFQSNDATLNDGEVLALLIGYTSNPNYDPYNDAEVSTQIYRLNANGDYSGAQALADSFLVTHPVDQKSLIEKAFALHKIGQESEASKCLSQFRAIMKAMASSGDGQSPQTAIFALGPIDGQNFVLKVLGCRIGRMGSGYDAQKHFLDILDAVSKDGQTTTTYYFNIDHAMGTFRKELEESKK